MLLDPACGEGVFLRAGLEEGFKNVVGFDVDSSVLDVVSENLKDKIIIKNALNETGFEGKCDVVVGNPLFQPNTVRSLTKNFRKV